MLYVLWSRAASLRSYCFYAFVFNLPAESAVNELWGWQYRYYVINNEKTSKIQSCENGRLTMVVGNLKRKIQIKYLGFVFGK